jgi:hypothetical protein
VVWELVYHVLAIEHMDTLPVKLAGLEVGVQAAIVIVVLQMTPVRFADNLRSFGLALTGQGSPTGCMVSRYSSLQVGQDDLGNFVALVPPTDCKALIYSTPFAPVAVVVIADIAPAAELAEHAHSGHTTLGVLAAVLGVASAVRIAIVVAGHAAQTTLGAVVAVRIEMEVAAVCTGPVAVGVLVVARDAEGPCEPDHTGLEAVAAAEHPGSLAHRDWGPRWVSCI